MWVCFYLVTALYVAGCSACGGCRLDPSKTTETVCSASTDKFMEHAHEDITMTESCDLITKGKKNWKVPVRSVELTVWGFVGERNISFHYGDMCKTLEQGAPVNKRRLEHKIKMFDIPSCDESVTTRNEVRERKIRNHHHHKLSQEYEGPFEIEIRLEKINGNEGDSVCLLLKGETICDKQE